MNPIQIYNNIGCEFIVDNNNFIITGPLSGYNTLDNNHIGSYIPYLVRNTSGTTIIGWEIGVGYVNSINNKIVVSKHNTIQSYGSLEGSGQKNFYLFANADNYNTGFNNVVVVDKDFLIAKTKTSYLIDSPDGVIHGSLPNASLLSGLEIQFKIIGQDPIKLDIRDKDLFHYVLRGVGSYVSMVSDGTKWVVLDEYQTSSNELTALSQNFTSMADPAGDDGAFQYKSGSDFVAGDVFFGANNKILFGPNDIEQNAKHILPTSGEYDTIINNTKDKSNFVVYGSGVPTGYLPNSLIFTYDGKLGLNLPSGTKPQTALHIINNSCKESIRIENLSSCPTHIPNITLYHKPSGVDSGSAISKVVFASRDSNKNRIDYSTIQTVAKDTTAGLVKGQLNLSVASGPNSITGMSIDPENMRFGYQSGHQLMVSNPSGIMLKNMAGSGAITLNNNSSTIVGSSIGLAATNINITGITNINQALIAAGTNVGFPYITKNKILSINSSGFLAPATTFEIDGVGPNKLLTTNSSGIITGAFADDSFLLTEGDIVWSKYSPRLVNICLRQIIPIDEFTTDEFGVGDQIAVVTGIAPNQGTIYRNITELSLSNNTITGMLLDQNVTFIDSTVFIYSVTKGGVLTTQIKTEDGTQSDATQIVLSTRPQTDTIFNGRQKDINFKVYGIEDNATLSVIAKAIIDPVNSGIYYGFSTRLQDNNSNDIEPFVTLISSIGEGIGTTNNSANFGNMLAASWPHRVTSVGTNGRASFYGTYDQNGNVYEWVEDNNRISSASTQRICGGSWRTASADGLRSIIPTPYSLELDDVGFRICSRYGYSDSTIDNDLLLSFSPISDLDNLSDDSDLYTESHLNRRGLQLPPEPISILNLGKVEQPYQISRYEITNSQYAAFLNAVNATEIFDLYNINMGSSIVGGINRSGSSGSYTYTTKTNMDNKPVVFVDYLSSIRFINWLHNGAPTNEQVNSSTTEDGAYTITSSISSTTITKNRDQKYWLPSLNEWHKAAYFQPVYSSVESDASAVLIRRELPYEISSGNLASLSVNGATYSDSVFVGDSELSTGALLSASVVNNTGITNINSGFSEYKINIGPPNNIVLESDSSEWDGEFSSYISPSNSGMQLATSGTIKLVSPSCVKISGLCLNDLFVQTISYVDEDGDVIPGGLYPGPNGGFIYKDLETDNPKASEALQFVSLGATNGVTLASSSFGYSIYTNASGILAGYPYFRLAQTVDGIDGEAAVISSFGEENAPKVPLIVDAIRIGPPLTAFAGSILTHNGTDTALWQPADFLRADGMTWTRHPKRAIEIISANLLRFSILDQTEGGTGPVSAEEILLEYDVEDTIAIYNQEREVSYVKIAAVVLAGESDSEKQFFTPGSEALLEITVCPPLSPEFVLGSQLELEDGSIKFIGYAFSVFKGAFLSMGIEPGATSRFSCDNGLDDENSPYGFKPSTINTISIRPTINTVFNKLAEDIDFSIYSYKTTLNNRYEPELFNQDSRGNPTGLIPALHIDSYNDSSFIGSISSGVIADSRSLFASGIKPDESAKITINTLSPYTVATISGVTNGLIYQDSIRPTGQIVVTSKDISTFADLTVGGYTFSQGLITTELVLKNTDRYSFIPNAPLTVNSLGQLVSVIPPPTPTISDAPIAVTGFPSNTSVRLQWSQPENTGGVNIINYLIQYSENGEIWTNTSDDLITDTQYLVLGLENGIGYQFRVAAVNSVGVSDYSSPSLFITPTSNAPTQPLNLVIIARTTTDIVLDWSPPSYLGPGSTSITNYIVEYAEEFTPPGPLNWIVWPETLGVTSNITIPITSEAITYKIRVRAFNGLTSGAYASIRSIGTDGEPENPQPEPEPANDWDFGEIAFTGVCL